MADSILDQLKAYQAAQDATRRTADEIQRERNLLKEVSSLAKAIKLEFNDITKNIGKSTENLELGLELEEKLKQSTFDRSSLQNSLLSLMRETVRQDKLVAELARVNSLTQKERNAELRLEKANLDAKLATGEIESLQHAAALQFLQKKYKLTSETYSKELLSVNRLSQQLVNTKGLLGTEDARLAKLKAQSGFMQLGKKVLGDMGPLGEKIISGKTLTAASLLTNIIEHGYKNFLAFDKAATAARMNLGALPGQVNTLEKNIKTVALDLSGIGATFDDVAASAKSLTDSFGSLVARDKQLLTTTTALSKQFGITGDTSAKFLETLGGISGKSAKSQLAMTGFAQKMAVAAGVPLGKIMEDVANASDEVRIYVGGSAVSMIKAAAAARMMGIDLNKAAASADKLLQFESSISAELKASALLGQSVNFNYARQLAFNKNIIGANKEILKITKQVNFNQLNPIQQKAYADAAGKSVGELQSMLQQEKNIQLVKNGTNKEAKAALADYERLMQMKDGEAKKEGEIAEQEIIRKANQERMTQIQNQFNKLMNELSKPVMDIVEPLLDLAVTVMPLLVGALRLMENVFEGISLKILTSRTALQGLMNPIKFIQNIFGMISTGISKTSMIGNIFAKMIPTLGKLGPLMRIFGTIAKFLGPIGWVMTAIQGLFKAFEMGKEIFQDFKDGNWAKGLLKIVTFLPRLILGMAVDIVADILSIFGADGLGESLKNGFKSVSEAIFDALAHPIESFKKLISPFLGNSPSEIGLMIVTGLKSVGGMILDALIGPFIKGYNFISKYIPGMSEMKMPNQTLSDITEDTKKTGNASKSLNNDNLNNVIQSGNQQLVAKIDQLMTMMANGGIAVNLDGQRINAALSTTILKSGGFGQATTRG
jgi:hypothetical protein